MPKVSICIPAYNQIKYLKKTIDSVLSQTYTDYEIVITDDSPGNIVKALVEEYDLPTIIKYYKNGSPLGSPENWNESIRKSTGEYIKILHHDDWLNYEDSLAKYVALLDDNLNTDFAFSATQVKNPVKKNWVHEVTPGQLNELKDNPMLLYRNNFIGAPSTTIFRRNRELFDKNLKWLVDIEYYIRQLTANKNIMYSNELLTVTFVAEDRVSDECFDNKEIEVTEYLYVLNILYNKHSFSTELLKACLLKAIAICDKHNIKNAEEIKRCGYQGKIHSSIRKYLALKNISLLSAKAFLKLLRNQ